MKNIFFIPLIILLFFAIIVGAMNIVNNTNNRPYRLSEFIADCANIDFNLTIVEDFFSDIVKHFEENSEDVTDRNAIGGHRGFDGRFWWQKLLNIDPALSFIDNIKNGLASFGIGAARLVDIVINVIWSIIQVVYLLWNFCVGVPIDPPSEASLPIFFRDFFSA